METAQEKPVRISVYGQDSLTIENLTEQERERMEGTLSGQWWVTATEDGRLDFSPTREPLPSPTADEAMMPFWSRPDSRRGGIQLELLDRRETWPSFFGASITIQHLCGYNFSPENYRHEAESLGSYGFICLRSQRGDDGKYWEIWFLPGLFFAQGDLREAIQRYKLEKKKLRAAVNFLCEHSSFGTLDVSVQRAAMPIESE